MDYIETLIVILNSIKRSGVMTLSDLHRRLVVDIETQDDLFRDLVYLTSVGLVTEVDLHGKTAFTLLKREKTNEWEKSLIHGLLTMFGHDTFDINNPRCQYVLFTNLATCDDFVQCLAAMPHIESMGDCKYRVREREQRT